MSFADPASHPLLGRRAFLGAAAGASVSLAVSRATAEKLASLPSPVRLGVIADLHQDIIHDAPQRMRAFVDHMRARRPDALLQLGDFAHPKKENAEVIDAFNGAHDRTLHVIGNHDTDDGHTKEQCLERWRMPSRYYVASVAGFQLIVLDGNDVGSPKHKGGYPTYIGEEQSHWLRAQLNRLDGPIIVLSHQPLAGPAAIDNGEELQSMLAAASDKIVLAINGHTHIDTVVQAKGVNYWHVNSAAYQWVGGDFEHESYPAEVHAQHPLISRTCPYRESLFAELMIDPVDQSVRIIGRQSEWVGPSPEELGVASRPGRVNGKEVAAGIRTREITG